MFDPERSKIGTAEFERKSRKAFDFPSHILYIELVYPGEVSCLSTQSI